MKAWKAIISALLEVVTMHKLLSANLRRLWLNKAFWVTVILMASIEGLLCLLLSKQGPLPVDVVLFLSLQSIGILASVFLSLFLGTEYSDGTIRNKLIVGHKRVNIYLASFITGVIAITIIYFAGVLTGCVMGLTSFAPPSHGIGQIAIAGVIGWLASVSYVSIFTLVGMISSSKSKTSIFCILTAFILVFAGLIIYALLQGTPSATLQFLFEVSPFGQTVQAMIIIMASPWRLAIYALCLSAALTGIGIVAFGKKDLK